MTEDLEVTIVWQKVWEAIHKFEPDGTRTYKYIILKGSSRSGKTYSLIDIIDLYCRSEDGKRCTVWRNTKTDCKQTVLFDTEKHLRETGRLGLAQTLNKTES